jgi:hypothetical protein
VYRDVFIRSLDAPCERTLYKRDASSLEILKQQCVGVCIKARFLPTLWTGPRDRDAKVAEDIDEVEANRTVTDCNHSCGQRLHPIYGAG